MPHPSAKGSKLREGSACPPANHPKPRADATGSNLRGQT